MSQCGAIDCNHNNMRERCKFYQLPTEPKLRAKWLKLMRRDPKSVPKVLRVCSCHFRDGKKENKPELFSFNIHKKFEEHHLSPERKKPRRKLQISPEQSVVKSLKNTLPQHSTQEMEALEIEIAPSEIYKIYKDVATNTDFVNTPSTSHENSSILLEAENYFLRNKVEELEKTVTEKLSYKAIKDNDKLVVLYTGLSDAKAFDILLDLLKDLEIKYYFTSKVTKIPIEDQVLLTLMKLRQNFLYEDLAFRFGICGSSVSNIFLTWINVLYEILYVQIMKKIPSRQKNKTGTFTNCRIILDCTEVFIEVPRKSIKLQKVTFSKGLVGVAPNGLVTFVSDLFPGSMSDKTVAQNSGLLDQLEPEDLVITNKGFLIGDILPPYVYLNVPPSLNSSKFSEEEKVLVTQQIERARDHVERAIGRMKCFKILELIPSSSVKHSNTIFKVIGALVNFNDPLINEVNDLINFEQE